MPGERYSSRIKTQMGESVLGTLIKSLLPEVKRASYVPLSSAERSRANQPVQEWVGYHLAGKKLDIDSHGIHRSLSHDVARTWRLLITTQGRGLADEALSPRGTAEPRVKIWRAKQVIRPYDLIIKDDEGYKLKEIE